MNDEIEGHILVVDDDDRLRSLLQRYLTSNGFMVSVASEATEAKRKLASLDFDLMVLDVMMPGQDGFSLTSELRRSSRLPILLLTAKGEVDDRIQGFEVGADDYLVKPFEPRELLLRISTILRRVRPSRTNSTVLFGDFIFDCERRELRCRDTTVYLTSGELALLEALALQPGKPMSRVELAERSGGAASDRAVDVQMTRLRKKIEEDPKQPKHLLTMRGEGYVLRAGR